MTASPLGPMGASGLHPPYLRASAGGQDHQGGCHAPRHPPQRSTALAQVMPPPNPVSRTWWPACSRPVVECVDQGEGDGRRGGVAVAVDDHDRLLLGDPEPLADGADDAQVGLVGDHQVDVVDGEAGLGDGLLGRLDDHPDRLSEDLLAVHVEIAAVVALEEVAERPVGAEHQDSSCPGPSIASSTTAPAPSPTSTAIDRSSQSVIRLRVSDPMTSSRSAPMASMPWATTSA